MNIIISIGILIFTGYIFGEIAEKVRLPKITGYIIAGIILSPDMSGIMSDVFIEQTDPLLSGSLAFITFSIGGTLSVSKLRETGKVILLLTLTESIFAFLSVFIFIFLFLYFVVDMFNSVYIELSISLILAALAAPTDPSATLAVINEYKAKGPVSSSMLGIAAFDDIVGIIIFTIVSSFSTFLVGKSDLQFNHIFLDLGKGILGSIILGVVVGIVFMYIVRLFRKQTDGTLIVLTSGLVLLTYGFSDYFGFESLLATMALGAVVTNLNPLAKEIFKLIERYTDELIFVIFFTLSGLNLDLSLITGGFLMIIIYIIARFIGKFSGIYTGAVLSKADPSIRKYAAGGLIPQGGIVIGMALLLERGVFTDGGASMIIGIVIGAALIHELIGPIISRISLKRAGEVS